jgi:cyclopropane fatty-acyl-phospholipid synthase-like methyltransferase
MPACIACGGADTEIFMDLGATPLANKFLAPDELGNPEPSFPLRVAFCPACGHVQLADIVEPPAMFDHYLYVSSASSTLENHLMSLAERVRARMDLKQDDFVIDIGANDGTLLSGFLKGGQRVLGVEPAANLRPLAEKRGVAVDNSYFGAATARRLRAAHGRAKVVTATNVFPHIPVLADFIAGLDEMLAPDGIFVLEAHYLQDLLDAAAFDTVYHEHCSYWAVRPMIALFARHGFEVVDVERLPIHHGQLRAWIRRKGVEAPSPRVAELSADEERRGMNTIAPFQALAEQAKRIRVELGALLDKLKAEGKHVVGYGAPAKGTTLLSYLDIRADRIEWIADRSPLKQGRFTPGTRIPIVPAERILAEKPDYVLLLAWNFIDEIVAQLAEYRAGGGRFIRPVPKVEILA